MDRQTLSILVSFAVSLGIGLSVMLWQRYGAKRIFLAWLCVFGLLMLAAFVADTLQL
jgi:hypothetical protein